MRGLWALGENVQHSREIGKDSPQGRRVARLGDGGMPAATGGGLRRKGLNGELLSASPAAFLNMARPNAEEAGLGTRKRWRGSLNRRSAVMRAENCRT